MMPVDNEASSCWKQYNLQIVTASISMVISLVHTTTGVDITDLMSEDAVKTFNSTLDHIIQVGGLAYFESLPPWLQILLQTCIMFVIATSAWYLFVRMYRGCKSMRDWYYMEEAEYAAQQYLSTHYDEDINYVVNEMNDDEATNFLNELKGKGQRLRKAAEFLEKKRKEKQPDVSELDRLLQKMNVQTKDKLYELYFLSKTRDQFEKVAKNDLKVSSALLPNLVNEYQRYLDTHEVEKVLTNQRLGNKKEVLRMATSKFESTLEQSELSPVARKQLLKEKNELRQQPGYAKTNKKTNQTTKKHDACGETKEESNRALKQKQQIIIKDNTDEFLRLCENNNALNTAYLLVGFGSTGKYNDFENVKIGMDAVVRELNSTHGKGNWCIVFGGDRHKPMECDIAHLTKYFSEEHDVPLLAVQFASKHIDDYVNYAFQYTKDLKYDVVGEGYTENDLGPDRAPKLYAGWYGALMQPGDDLNKGLAGASKFYFREFGETFLRGVLAFGGGMVSCQDVRYALKKNVKVWFLTSEPKIWNKPEKLKNLWNAWWRKKDKETREGLWLQTVEPGDYESMGPVHKLYRDIVACGARREFGNWTRVNLDKVDPLKI